MGHELSYKEGNIKENKQLAYNDELSLEILNDIIMILGQRLFRSGSRVNSMHKLFDEKIEIDYA